MQFLDPFFNFIFAPLLYLSPGIVIIVVSFLISLLISLAAKLFTDQKQMKSLKDQMKSYQEEMKANKDNAEKVIEVQKQAMKVNMEYMKKSFRVTLITLIPIILVFGWLNAHFAYEPLMPGNEFVIGLQAEDGVAGNVSVSVDGLEVVGGDFRDWDDGSAAFTFKGPEGEYLITFSSGDASADVEVLITEDRAYAPIEGVFKDDVFKSYTIGNERLKVWGLSWFWLYLISAIVFSSLLRKLLKVY